MKIILNSTDNLNFSFTEKDGSVVISSMPIKEVIERLYNDAFELLPEPECQESGCKIQGFCECGSIYDDFEVKSVALSVS